MSNTSERGITRGQFLRAAVVVALGGPAALAACTSDEGRLGTTSTPSTHSVETSNTNPPITLGSSVATTIEPRVLPETTLNIPKINPEQINGVGPLIYSLESTYDKDGNELITPPDWIGPVVVDLTLQKDSRFRIGFKNPTEAPSLFYNKVFESAAFQRGMSVEDYVDMLSAQEGANIGIDTELLIPKVLEEEPYPDLPTAPIKPQTPIDWKKGIIITDNLDIIPEGERTWSNIPQTLNKGDTFAIVVVDGQMCFYFPHLNNVKVTDTTLQEPLWRKGESLNLGLDLMALINQNDETGDKGELYSALARKRSDVIYSESNPFGYRKRNPEGITQEQLVEGDFYQTLYVSTLFDRYPPAA